MLIIRQDPFISQSSPGHSPQPRIDFSYYEISGPDICSLICGSNSLHLWFYQFASFYDPMSNTYLDQQVFIIHLLACPRKKPDMAWIGHLLHAIPRAAAVQIRVSGVGHILEYEHQSLVGLPSIKARINRPSRALTSMLGKQACCSCSATVFCTTCTIGHFHEILSHKNFYTV